MFYCCSPQLHRMMVGYTLFNKKNTSKHSNIFETHRIYTEAYDKRNLSCYISVNSCCI